MLGKYQGKRRQHDAGFGLAVFEEPEIYGSGCEAGKIRGGNGKE